jgi:hypothetical protein
MDLSQRPGFYRVLCPGRGPSFQQASGAPQTAVRVDKPFLLDTVKESMNNHASSREAKAIVALAFRNGPIEDVHAGKLCPTCAGKPEYSHITQQEMKQIMKNAVDHVYRLLSLKENDPGKYEVMIDFGAKYTVAWDDPAEPASR